MENTAQNFIQGMSDEQLEAIASQQQDISALPDAELELIAQQSEVPPIPEPVHPKTTEDIPYGAGLASQALQGASFYTSDEIMAGMDALTGEDYNPDRYRQFDKTFEMEHPKAALAAQVVGGLTTGGTGAAKVLGSQAVKRAPGVVKGVLAPAAVAATEGAVAGAGNATEGHRVKGAGIGAGTGLVLGAGMGAGTGAVKKLVVDPLMARTKKGAERIGTNAVERAMARDKLTPEQAMQKMDELGPDAALIDAGPNLSATGEVIAGRPGQALTTAKEFLEKRGNGQAARILEGLEKSIGKPGTDIIEDLDTSKMFQDALKQRVPLTGKLKGLLMRPGLTKAYAKARQLAAEQGEELPPVKDVLSGNFVEVETTVLHWLKKGLDDVLEPKRDAVTGMVQQNFGQNQLRALKKTRYEFRSLVKKLNPEYGKALGTVASGKRLEGAFDKGANFYKLRNPRSVEMQMKGMTDAEKRAYRRGIVQAVEDKVTDKSNLGYDVSRIVLGQAEKFEAAFGMQGKDLIQAIRNDRDMMGTARTILGNSRTSFRREAAADFEGGVADNLAGAGMDAMTGNKVGLASRMARGASNYAKRPPEAAADKAAGILFTSDRKAIQDALSRTRLPSVANPTGRAAIGLLGQQGGANIIPPNMQGGILAEGISTAQAKETRKKRKRAR